MLSQTEIYLREVFEACARALLGGRDGRVTKLVTRKCSYRPRNPEKVNDTKKWLKRHQGGVSHPVEGLLGWLRKCRATGGIAAILSQHRAIYQKFRKGVGGQRGLARGNPSFARDSGVFSVPFFLCPFRRRGTRSFVANPLPPTPFRNLRI